MINLLKDRYTAVELVDALDLSMEELCAYIQPLIEEHFERLELEFREFFFEENQNL